MQKNGAMECPKCGSKNIEATISDHYLCKDCGKDYSC